MRAYNLAIFDGISLEDIEIALDLHTRQRVKPNKYTAFTWSSSRHNMFEKCKRKYYLHYYGARRVREANDPVVSAIWWLKQAATRQMWIGSVIHQVARKTVKAWIDGNPMSREQVVKEAADYYRGGVNASQRGIKFDDQWVVLLDDIYPNLQTGIDRAQAETRVNDLANALVESEAFAFICGQPKETIRELDEEFQSFLLDNVPKLGTVRVFAIPDVLVADDKAGMVIDWKTGDIEQENIRYQMGVYQLYVHLNYNLPEEAITVRLADLNTGELVEPPGGIPTLAEADGCLRGSIRDMVNMMEDPMYNTVSIRKHPMTDNLSQCRYCGFMRVCQRHGAAIDG
nr:PD-(D/E)XK nuclease family protein [Anaerolineae bacterium]